MRYSIHGLVIKCDFGLSHDRYAPGDIEPDIYITLQGSRAIPMKIAEGRRLQAVASQYGMLYSTVERESGWVLLRFHGHADFEIDPDRRYVQVWIDPRCSTEMLSILAAGNVLATVLALKGETVLHASAVEVDGRALACVADSGMGKSTLAALACARGGRFVTDDVLRLRYDEDGSVWCWPGATENRLRRDVADLSDSYLNVHQHTTVDARIVWKPPASTRESTRLHAVVLPAPQRGRETLKISKIEAGRAIIELTRRPRLQGWIDPAGLLRTFTNLSQLVSRVPVYDAHVPWGPPFDLRVIDALFTSTGLIPV